MLNQLQRNLQSNNIFEQNLPITNENYAALTPIYFLERFAFVYPNHTATVNDDIRFR